MTRDEAERAARQVRAETRLLTTIHNDGDKYWVDIDLPTHGEELRAVVTLHDADDWSWLGPTHVLPRIRQE